MDPCPMDAAKGDANSNPMYPQSNIKPDVSPGSTMDPNPMYQPSTIKHSAMDAQNAVNPNPMYLHSIMGPPNVIPDESTVMSDENGGISSTEASDEVHQLRPEGSFSPAENDNHCIKPYAVTRYQDGEAASTTSIASDDEDIQPYAAAYMCQDDVPCNRAYRDTQKELSSQNQPTAASNETNDNLGNRSNHDVQNALNPNPMYVPNVQHPAACAESGDRKLEKITVTGINLAYGLAVSADNEIFVPGLRLSPSEFQGVIN
ncbi:hypothetical protein Bbelb_365400 [Branchiostoma belcheri]|nr:hypothetical protein Bbelb_365400 [Branchiostoma belcheri]